MRFVKNLIQRWKKYIYLALSKKYNRIEYVFERAETIEFKKIWYFLLFPTMFSEGFPRGGHKGVFGKD